MASQFRFRTLNWAEVIPSNPRKRVEGRFDETLGDAEADVDPVGRASFAVKLTASQRQQGNPLLSVDFDLNAASERRLCCGS
jgi:hypothetical protein